MKRQKNSFLTPLVVEVMPSGKMFKVYNKFTYHWGMSKISVPVGFVTDFASIPRVARIIIPKLGKWTKAAVIHDYLYQNSESGTRYETGYIKWSRKGADIVFRDAMADLGVVAWKRWVMWAAVRIGGWLAWRKR